ncbi:MAG TPA: hypothetical protein H9866_05810 [Candidatus Tidjanibacter gallistercoris]|nr:hypothetical protein [Candidatus Tidjanibacter gallistercoris]
MAKENEVFNFVFAGPNPVFSKDSERQAQQQKKTRFQFYHCRAAACLTFRQQRLQAETKENRAFILSLTLRLLSYPKIGKEKAVRLLYTSRTCDSFRQSYRPGEATAGT